MDPSPNSHPILSYVLSRLPSIKTGSPRLSSPRDLEQPPPLSPSPRAPSGPAEFELVERMPGLRHPSVLRSMTRAVADITCARDALRHLGPRPDQELVDSSRAFLLSHSHGNLAGLGKEEDIEEKVVASQEVVRLDEEHEAYGVLLREAEEKLERVYRMAMHGRDVVEGGGKRREDEGSGDVDEEVVRLLKQAEESRCASPTASCATCLSPWAGSAACSCSTSRATTSRSGFANAAMHCSVSPRAFIHRTI